MEIGMQGHLAPAGRKAKIWSVGHAIDHNLVKSANILSSGSQYPADALDRAQVRMVERIRPAHRSVPRTLCPPRTKQSARHNQSHRLGISEVRFKVHGRTRPNVRHNQTLNIELQRQLIRLLGIDDQLRVLADESINHDLQSFPFWPDVSHLPTLAPRRQIQLQSSNVDRVHVSGGTKKGQDSHMKPEFRDTDNRLH